MPTEQVPSIAAVAAHTRSWLFTPATHPEPFEKESSAGADVSIVDLEDSVPLAQKYVARENACDFLARRKLPAGRPLLAIRVKNSFSRFEFEDLNALAESEFKPDFILLQKIEPPEQVIAVHPLLAKYGKVPALVPMIESAVGLRKAESIALASSSIAALIFGAADFASNVPAQPDSLTSQIARCQVAMACATASIKAIDAPCFALHDATPVQGHLQFSGKKRLPRKSGHTSLAYRGNQHIFYSLVRSHRLGKTRHRGIGTRRWRC
jgi:(S)-citramalyl-CoA lyase